jgi:hypothetical protein
MVFHTNSIKEFKKIIQSWNSSHIVVIVIGVKGGGDSRGKEQLMIVDGKGEFDQDDLAMGNNFRLKYE